MAAEPAPREPHLAVLFFVAHRAAEQRVMAVLAEHGHEVTLAQARVMQRIGDHGTRLTELAEAAQVTKQTAGYLVDQLERQGYVERVPDPTDARARLVRIAARGEEARTVARVVEEEITAEWAAHLGERDARTLRGLMERLREITDPWA